MNNCLFIGIYRLKYYLKLIFVDNFSVSGSVGVTYPNVSATHVAVNDSIAFTCELCYKSSDPTVGALIDLTQSSSCLQGSQFPPTLTSSGCVTSFITILATAPLLQSCTCRYHLSAPTSVQSYFDTSVPTYSFTWSSPTEINVARKYILYQFFVKNKTIITFFFLKYRLYLRRVGTQEFGSDVILCKHRECHELMAHVQIYKIYLLMFDIKIRSNSTNHANSTNSASSTIWIQLLKSILLIYDRFQIGLSEAEINPFQFQPWNWVIGYRVQTTCCSTNRFQMLKSPK